MKGKYKKNTGKTVLWKIIYKNKSLKIPSNYYSAFTIFLKYQNLLSNCSRVTTLIFLS